MAIMKLFQNIDSNDIVVCPFARGVTDQASGRLNYYSLEEFKSKGMQIINDYFAAYYDRKTLEPSELYNSMSERERNIFFKSHQGISLGTLRGKNQLTIYSGEDLSEFGTLPFPLKDENDIEFILRAFR